MVRDKCKHVVNESLSLGVDEGASFQVLDSVVEGDGDVEPALSVPCAGVDVPTVVAEVAITSDSTPNSLPCTFPNVCSLPTLKKNWKLPEKIEQAKLLITDENFTGPIPNDFFHVILPGCSLWDLNNVIKNSLVPINTSLFLIHIGYNKIENETNLKYLTTIYNKITAWNSANQIFFTALVSKSVNRDFARFNTFASKQLPNNFLNVLLQDDKYNNNTEKSELLFQKWCACLITKN